MRAARHEFPDHRRAGYLPGDEQAAGGLRVGQQQAGVGVRVPEVLYFEHRNEALGMAVLLTTELAGSAIAREGLGARTPDIVAAAGRDLAIINSLPVAGFGWVRRDAPLVTDLAAELPTNRAFLTEHLESDLAFLGTALLAAPDTREDSFLLAQAVRRK